jgi:pimeloyl-ACP methyl ester carboxylesterase
VSRQRFDTCLKSLSQKTDPAYYTSFAMAADTNAIREALGYDKINIFGTSYGTWLGQIYLGLYGSTVNGILLEGVVGPWNNPYLKAGSNFDASLNHVFDVCKADAACNQAYPDLPGKLKTALDSLKAKPLQVSGVSSLTGKAYPVVMTPNRLLGTLREMLAQGSAVASIPKMIGDAADGVYTYAAAIQVSLAEQSDSLSLGVFQSVACAESVAFFTDDMIKQYMTGSFYGLGDELILDIVDSCKGWRSAELDAAQLAPVKSERPVLIFSGGFDPITPVAFGEETNKRLSHSTLAVFPYEGHGVLPFNGCAQSLAAQFFKTPDAPIDTQCTTRDVKQVFDGTYTVDWAPYQDPNGAFSVQIPKDWAVLPAKESNSRFTFFASPKGTGAQQYLGVWNSTNTTGGTAAVQPQAEAALKAQFGSLDLATTLTMGGVTVSQYSLTTPDEVYAGALIIFSAGQNARVVWYAAPLNEFSATFSEIAIKVLTSLRG